METRRKQSSNDARRYRSRRGDGDSRLHVAGTIERSSSRSAFGHFFIWRNSLRDAFRPPCFSSRVSGGDHERDLERRSTGVIRHKQNSLACLGTNRKSLSGEESGSTFSFSTRYHFRTRSFIGIEQPVQRDRNECGAAFAPLACTWWLPWGIAGTAVLLAAFAFAWPYFRRSPSGEITEATRFIIPMPDKALILTPPVISPDGRRIVYRLNTEDGKELLWVSWLGSFDAQALVGTDGGSQPFWSPDSRSVGFFANSKLKRIDVSGGSVQTLCDAASNVSGAWSRNGTIIFSRGVASGLYRVTTAGETPVQLTQVDASRNEIEHTFPYFLPDGRHFIYLVRNAQPENSAIYVGSLDSKETKSLLQVHSSAVYAPPGYLLFVRENTLMAQAFNADTLDLKGEAFAVAEQAMRNPIIGRAMFSVSENGVLVMRSGVVNSNQLIWFDSAGKQLSAVTPPGGYNMPALSPDEKSVAVSRADLLTGTASDIWLINLERGTQIRLTDDPATDNFPAWSATGDRITFASTRNRQSSIYVKLSNGSAVEEPLVSSAEQKFNPTFSPDGKFIIYSQLNPKTNLDLYLVSTGSDKKIETFLQTNFIEAQARVSPNGRWVAYISDETGKFEVYIQTFPVAGGKVAVSVGGGSQPQWRADGQELYYYAPSRKLMAVEVNSNSPTFGVGIARPLFDIRSLGAAIDQTFPGNGYYTSARNGKRFLVPSLPETPQRQQINVILNWTADLKK